MRKLIFALALGAILIPNNGFALGLGEIEVNSALNQKLTARIDILSAAPEDAESLLIRLASREEFVRAGLDRPMVLASLKFKTSVEDGRVYIDVFSPKPIREPFLNFLVEVDWPKGHLIREYTILLDPPTFMGGQKNAAAVPHRSAVPELASRAPVKAPSSADDGFRPAADGFRPSEDDFRPTAQSSGSVEPVVATPVAREVLKSEPIQRQQRYTAPAPRYTAPAPRYTAPTPRYTPPAGHRIQKGDTAWSIANRTKPDSVSTQQMLIAMLRTNPDVFIDGNLNGIKRGFILRMPDEAAINAVKHNEAIAVVRQQNALWREYQHSLSSDKPASAISENYTETESSTAVDSMNDKSRLSIVSAGSGSSASGEMDASVKAANKLHEQLAVAREQVETERVEKETLQQQVDSLSDQVEKMKSLLVIEDKAMAEMQSAKNLSDDKALALDASDKTVVEDTVVAEEAVADTEDTVAEPGDGIEEPASGVFTDLADTLTNLAETVTNLFNDEPPAEEDLALEATAEETLEIESPAGEDLGDLELAAEELFVDEAAVEQVIDTEVLTEQEMLTSCF